MNIVITIIFILLQLSLILSYKLNHADYKYIVKHSSQSISTWNNLLLKQSGKNIQSTSRLYLKQEDKSTNQPIEETKEPTILEQVASKGLAGVLAIALAEAIFWALGVPLAAIWYKVTTGEWIDMMTTDGQLKAAGFSFGYGGFATVILQYRVTLFAIPLVPLMEKYVVDPAKKIFGEQIDSRK